MINEQQTTNFGIQCRCGSITIGFYDIIASLECCCVNCYDKNLWSCKMGNVKAPKGLECHGKGKPLSACYIPNRLVMVSGDPMKLIFNRLREGQRSTNMVASCCYSLLCVENTNYNGNILLIFPEFCPLIKGNLPSPTLRCHVKDWPSENLEKLQEMQGYYLDPFNPSKRYDAQGNEDIGNNIAETMLKYKNTPIQSYYVGNSFQELMRESKSAVEYLNIPEGENSYSRRIVKP